MLLPILYLVVLSVISLSLVAFFLTHPRERREPTPHGEREPEARAARGSSRGRRTARD